MNPQHMKGVPMKVHLLAVALMGLIALPALGQDDKLAFEEANANDYKHGKLLRLSVKGKSEKVVGTVVRTDKKAGMLYVRTSPGMLPEAIALNDIMTKEKQVMIRTIKTPNPMDPKIVLVTSSTKDITNPEIQEITFVNGNVTTVRYIGESLSAGERSSLADLERAYNELAALEGKNAAVARNTNLLLENELAIQTAERQREETLALQLLRQPYTDPLLRQGSTSVRREIDGTITPFGFGIVPGSMSIYNGGTPMRMDPNLVAKLITPTDPQALAAAQNKVVNARARAVFEDDRLVAFVPAN